MTRLQPQLDDDADQQGRTLSRTSLVILAAVGAVVIVAVVLAARTGPGPTGDDTPTATITHQRWSPAPVSVSSTPPIPGSDGPGLPGAVAMVERIVTIEPVLATDSPAAAAAVVAGWTTPAARAGIDAGLAAARATLADTRGGPYRFDAAVLEARAAMTGTGSATVDVWCSEVVFAQARPVYASYVTEHFDLDWSSGGWLVASTADTDGPSVGLETSTAATPPAEAQSALAGFAPAGALIDGGDR